MRQSDIAVVIPYYNGSKHIRRAIESVFAQTLPADEFVIVNDGSRETEARFLHELCTELGVRVIDKPNGGQGSARNAGVAATSAAYICFLDQDDFYLPEHNAILRRAVPETDDNFGWVYADLSRGDEDGVVHKEVDIGLVAKRVVNPKTDLKQVLSEDMFVLPSASLISRRGFDAVRGFDEQFRGFEDDDMFRRMFEAGLTNIFLPDLVYVWCVHLAMTSNSFVMTQSRVRYWDKLLAEFPDDPSNGKFYMRDCFVPRFASHMIKDARRAHKPEHGLYPHRDEIFGFTARCVEQMLHGNTLTGQQTRSIKFGWFKVLVYRYGLLGALLNRAGPTEAVT
jgi:glycosyltransferase involved in cell wall biosynthesis